MKSAFQSKTIWYAMATALVGGLTIGGQVAIPTDKIGWMLVGSGVAQAALRFITNGGVKF